MNREYLLREISGKITCPDCKKAFLYIGDGWDNPSLFCPCGFRQFIEFSKPSKNPNEPPPPSEEIEPIDIDWCK